MGAGAREPGQAGESRWCCWWWWWWAALSFVPEFSASRWPAVRGGNPGGCSSRMAMLGAASSRAGRGQRATEEARKSFERGMRGLRARRGERNGGLHRGGPVRPALRLLCAPSPKSATPPPGTGTTRSGRARSVAGNRVRVFGLLPALLEGWETRVRGLGPPRSRAGPRSPKLSPATWVTRLTSSCLLRGVGEAGVEGWCEQRLGSRRQEPRGGREDPGVRKRHL